ncbi:thioredoxin [Agaribacterium haliotis]|uniref:thioredoxin n=1 Tax=Agaribacterium haliotis TaxID=2013869 RepID=UPI000BB55B8A|nr:thioredoxin [Agaribacterium haliotis]
MSEHIVEITPENAQSLLIEQSQKRLVLVDFWADWCAPCKALMPVLEKLAVEYAGQFLLAKINADEQQMIVAQFGVQSLPTVMLLKDGQPIDGFTGSKTEAEIRELLDQHLPKAWESDWQQAVQYVNDGQFGQALPLLKAAYVDSGQRADIALDYCSCLLHERRLELAEQVLAAVKMADQDGRYQQLKAQLELAQLAGKSPELEALEQQLEAEPENLELVQQLAVQYAQNKFEEEALALLYSHLSRNLNALDGELKRCFNDVLASLDKGDALATKYQRKLYTLLY